MVTAGEKSSLTTAIIITVPIYVILFAALSVLHFDALPPGTKSVPHSTSVLLVDVSSDSINRGSARAVGSVAHLQTGRSVSSRDSPAGLSQAAGGTAVGRSSAAAGSEQLSAAKRDRGRAGEAGLSAADNAPETARSGFAAPVGASGEVLRLMRVPSVRNALSRQAGDGNFPATTVGAGGAQTGEGSATAPGNSETRTIASVLSMLRLRILSERSYPVAARRRGIQGRVTVAVTVGADGQLIDLRLLRSSGSDILDQAGLTLLRRVFPIPNRTSQRFTVDVPITYQLDSSG